MRVQVRARDRVSAKAMVRVTARVSFVLQTGRHAHVPNSDANTHTGPGLDAHTHWVRPRVRLNVVTPREHERPCTLTCPTWLFQPL